MKSMSGIFQKMYPVFGLNIAMGFVLGGFVALLPLLREDFGLSRAEVGFFTSSFFGASLFTAIFAGNLIDRMGIRKSIFLGGIVMGLAMGLFSLAPVYYLILFLALFAGLGESMITPAGNKSIMMLAGDRMNNTLLGFFRSAPGLGGLLGASLLPAFALHWGWRSVNSIGPLCMVLLSILIFTRGNFHEEDIQVKEKGSLWRDVLVFLRDPHCRFALLCGFSFAVILAVVVTYIPLWLHEGPGVSLAMAGLGLGMARLGAIVGRPFWGYLADRTGNEESILLLESALVLVITLVFSLTGNSLSSVLLMVLIFGLGFAGMGFEGVYFGFLGRIAGLERTGVMTGVALTFFRLAVMIVPPIFGYIADTTSSYTFSWLLVTVFPALNMAYYFFGVRGREAVCCSQ